MRSPAEAELSEIRKAFRSALTWIALIFEDVTEQKILDSEAALHAVIKGFKFCVVVTEQKMEMLKSEQTILNFQQKQK